MKIHWDGQSKNIIGSNIKKLRLESKMTQKDLAEKLQLCGGNFSALTILRIEQGKRFVSDFEILALSEFFNVSTDSLFDREK